MSLYDRSGETALRPSGVNRVRVTSIPQQIPPVEDRPVPAVSEGKATLVKLTLSTSEPPNGTFTSLWSNMSIWVTGTDRSVLLTSLKTATAIEILSTSLQ